MQQDLIEDPHAISSWLKVRLTRDGMMTVLVVETNLVLNAQDPDFDTVAVNSLFAKVQEYLATHEHIDSADIEPTVD
jgi:hypothetical protein